jgi:hypothetical protein
VKLHFIAISCTTSYYTKTNGGLACGILLPTQFTYFQAVSACNNLGGKMSEPKSLADMQSIVKLMVKYII